MSLYVLEVETDVLDPWDDSVRDIFISVPCLPPPMATPKSIKAAADVSSLEDVRPCESEAESFRLSPEGRLGNAHHKILRRLD